MLTHKNCLTVVPVGGLGNRLLALFSAIHLVSIGKFDSLRVLWDVHEECNIAFEDIGTINTPHEMIHGDDLGFRSDNSWSSVGSFGSVRRGGERLNEFLPYFDGQIITTCTNFSCPQTHCDGVHPTIIDLPHANLFQFAEKHYQKANTIDVSGHIGIHCRRTDFATFVVHSEIEEGYMIFTASDDKMINYANSITDKLFIATDSPYTLARLRTAVGSRLIHYPKHHYPIYSGKMVASWKPIERSADCVVDAIIDIILLSRCTQIIAESASSFPTISSILGNIPKTVI